MKKNLRQVILMRKDLKMRKGKMIAQGAHASLGSYLINEKSENPAWKENLNAWLSNSFTKIALGVNSEAELLDFEQKAKDLNIASCLITDNGDTEFHGVKTITCLCLGPDTKENLDKITKELKLL